MTNENFRNSIGGIIAIMIVAGTLIIDTLVLLREVKSNDNTTMIVLTGLNSATTIILGYYFGSSKAMTDRLKSENTIDSISKETIIKTKNQETK